MQWENTKMVQGYGELCGGLGRVKQFLVLAGLFVLLSGTVQAADLKWSGRYRAEGVFIKNQTLSNPAGVENSYILHHLILSPEIIPTDGIKIRARFDIFNNALGNNQIGQ